MSAPVEADVAQMVADALQWPVEECRVHNLSAGTTNELFVAQNGSCGTSVVIKLFGQGTEGYIDRDKEAALLALLSEEEYFRGSCGLLARIPRGFVYRYVEGTVLTAEVWWSGEYFGALGETLAHLHGLPCPGGGFSANRAHVFILFEQLVLQGRLCVS